MLTPHVISGCQGILLITITQGHRLTEQPTQNALSEGEPCIGNEMFWPGSKQRP